MRQSTGKARPTSSNLILPFFDGNYVTGDVNEEYLEQLELIRSDAAKEAQDEATRTILGLHNNN